MKTPYFRFNQEKLKENYREFEDLCEKYFDKFIIAYSVKTNSYNQVIKTLNKEGSNFEVASLNEIKKTPKKSKIFNGPCKKIEELEIAIREKFLINVDSKSELDLISGLIEGGEEFNIGLRVSLKESKFGFSENQLKEIIIYAKSLNLNVISLHFHCGTQVNFREYEQNLRKASEILKKLNFPLKYIDVGGGFPDKIQLKNLNASLENYFKVIEKYLKKFNSTIILEPGRNLVADAFDLITRVNVIKENYGKRYVILDAGINFLPKITLSTYKFSKLNEKYPGEIKQDYVLVGPLLFSNDVLGRYVGNLNEGDLIKVENVGAYCYNLSWEISYDKPRIYIS